MADVSIANLPAFVGTAIPAATLLVIVDVGDTTESPLGTTKKATVTQAFANFPGSITATPNLIVTGTAAQSRGLAFQTLGSNRWYLFVNNTAEGGGNAGGDFQLSAYSDTAVLIDSPITINRAAGGPLTISRPVFMPATVVVGSVGASSKLIIEGAAGGYATLQFNAGGVAKWFVGRGPTAPSDNYEIYNLGTSALCFSIASTTNVVSIPSATLSTQGITIGGVAPSANMSLGWSAATGGAIQTFSSKWLSLNPLGGPVVMGNGTWPVVAIGQTASRVGMISSDEDQLVIIGNMQAGVGALRGGTLRFFARGAVGQDDAAAADIRGERESAASGNYSTHLVFKTMNAVGALVDAALMDYLDVANTTRLAIYCGGAIGIARVKFGGPASGPGGVGRAMYLDV